MLIEETMEELQHPVGRLGLEDPETAQWANNDTLRLSEADAVAGVTSTRFTWPCDFNDIAALQTIVAGHWIRQLNTGELCLF